MASTLHAESSTSTRKIVVEKATAAEWVRQNLRACQNPVGKDHAWRKATTGRRVGEQKPAELLEHEKRKVNKSSRHKGKNTSPRTRGTEDENRTRVLVRLLTTTETALHCAESLRQTCECDARLHGCDSLTVVSLE